MGMGFEPDRASAAITKKLEEHLEELEAEWAFFR